MQYRESIASPTNPFLPSLITDFQTTFDSGTIKYSKIVATSGGPLIPSALPSTSLMQTREITVEQVPSPSLNTSFCFFFVLRAVGGALDRSAHCGRGGRKRCRGWWAGGRRGNRIDTLHSIHTLIPSRSFTHSLAHSLSLSVPLSLLSSVTSSTSSSRNERSTRCVQDHPLLNNNE